MKNRFMSKGIVALLLLIEVIFIPLSYAEEAPVPPRHTATGVKKTVSNGNREFHQSIPLRMIITESRSEAVEILSGIMRGKAFLFIAHDRSSERNNADNYGYLGEVDPLTLDPEVRRALAFLKEGESSGIIKLVDGRYALIEIVKKSFFADAEKAFMMGNLGNAERLLIKHLELNPDDIKARMMISALYEDQKQTLKAEDALDQAIYFKPKAVEPYERLGKLYLRQGDYAKARDIFRKALKNTAASRIFEKLLEITEIHLIGAAR